MKKLPFVIIRLAATLIVVAVCYFVFNLDPIYLTIIGVVVYALFDVLGYQLYVIVKKWAKPSKNPKVLLAKITSQPQKKSSTVNSVPDKLSAGKESAADLKDFLSLNRRLDFVIYFDAPVDSEHQVLMWIPYLSALRKNYVIVLRSKTYEKIFKNYALPIVILPKLSDLEKIVDAGVKFVFYVNNGMRNTHMVRYNDIIHIQLLHGDSDKPASYNPISIIYDYLFVAGEMAINRYGNNNVKIPKEKFEIVGRPQTEELIKSINKEDLFNRTVRTVLYTTTWSGFQKQANFSSILYAKEIVTELVASGFRVIFRPHPHSVNDKNHSIIIKEIKEFLTEKASESGVGHCVSNDKDFGYVYKSSTDCINGADILLSDISSMVSDWLYSAKPYILIDTHNDREAFFKANPMAAGAYYVGTELGDIGTMLTVVKSEIGDSDSEFSDADTRESEATTELSGLQSILKEITETDTMWDQRLKTRFYALGLSLEDDPLEKFVLVTENVFKRHEAIFSLSEET